MEKYVRVSEMNKDHPVVFTAEEIVDNARGVGSWMWNGANFVCSNCICGSRESSRFCKFCGARMED